MLGSKKALFFILSITYILFSFLAIKNYYLGEKILASSLLSFVILASINTRALYTNSSFPINMNIVISTLMLSLFLSIYYLGATTIFWAYPISLALIYILPHKQALIFNLIIFTFISLFSFLNMEIPAALRVSLSLFLTILITSLIAKHIHKLHQDLIHESIRDPMTGALNRRQLSTHLETSLAYKKRNNINSAILMFDIDHFKRINDNFGHDIGDKVIIKLVKLINEHSREVDLLFRIGGEEFILLMNDIDINFAQDIAEKLRMIIRVEPIIENHPVTVSIGICAPLNHFSIDIWVKNADNALYVAKNQGRNQVHLYQPYTQHS